MYQKIMAAWVVKSETKRRMKGLFLKFLGASVVYFLLTTGVEMLLRYILNNSASGILASNLYVLLASGPLLAGLMFLTLTVIRNHELRFTDLFIGFEHMFKIIGLFITMTVFTMLWSLLLFIPGIIAAYSYSMALYVMLDDPSKGILQCIRESKEMMRGNKFALFATSLSIQLIWIILVLVSSVLLARYGPDVLQLEPEVYMHSQNYAITYADKMIHYNNNATFNIANLYTTILIMKAAPLWENIFFIFSCLGLAISGAYMNLCTATFYDMVMGRIDQGKVVENEESDYLTFDR